MGERGVLADLLASHVVCRVAKSVQIREQERRTVITVYNSLRRIVTSVRPSLYRRDRRIIEGLLTVTHDESGHLLADGLEVAIRQPFV